MKTVLNCLVVTGLALLAGCGGADDPLKPFKQAEMAPAPPPPMVIEQADQDVQRRFESGSEEKSGAVQNAVLWAERYEEMSVKNNELREQNSKLVMENSQLKNETEKVRQELERTRGELNEANEFIQQMHVELNKWKSDVLGYRDEMRQAQQAELAALTKILRLLGAEPAAAPEAAKPEAGSAAEKE